MAINVHKIELYIWGLNDQEESTIDYVKQEIENGLDHSELSPIFGETRTVKLDVEWNDDIPLNLLDQQLEYARKLMNDGN